jgi:hypothetical protein
MNTPDYTEKIKVLREKVGNYSGSTMSAVGGDLTKKISVAFSNITSPKSPLFYLLPIVSMFILLLVIKPSFMVSDSITKDNTIKKHIDYKKLIIASLIIGFAIDVGIFIYLRRK